ncbi:PREDICTED: citrate-binding protein-like [Prunus mume]|uniref:Citrate-binding protein-like n=1 Tax=Prunus mume TaxID=102107 RepID=A0ABM0PD12_PRUMU|nr:PREDICTED: citrate-binding protein-like [Prunus mume]
MLPLNCIKMNSFFGKLLCLILLILKYRYICAADPTDGFTLVPLTDENFKLQKPYNEPLNDRYSDKDGVRSFWIYNHDKPFKTDSTTRPRSEARITGHDYSSGIWQFEGYAFVPSGTSGVTIVQIHGAAEGATSLQLRMYDGDIKYYKYNVVATNLYDKWFRVNIIHNVDKGKIIVFIDGVKKFVVKDQGPGDLYFKCGVYAAPENSSNYMESRWKEIKLYKK